MDQITNIPCFVSVILGIGNVVGFRMFLFAVCIRVRVIAGRRAGYVGWMRVADEEEGRTGIRQRRGDEEREGEWRG